MDDQSTAAQNTVVPDRVAQETAAQAQNPVGDPATTLSSNRTALSFERTLMSADRTLMSSVRTALSLISFGFTIAQLFTRLLRAGAVSVGTNMPRNFGLALIILGIAILLLGIFSHRHFQRELNQRGDALYRQGLLAMDIHYRLTPTFLAAIGLTAIGVAAVLSLTVRAMGAAS